MRFREHPGAFLDLNEEVITLEGQAGVAAHVNARLGTSVRPEDVTFERRPARKVGVISDDETVATSQLNDDEVVESSVIQVAVEPLGVVGFIEEE